MSEKQKKWILIFVISFWGVILFLVVGKIVENYKMRKGTISFQTEYSDCFLQEIITASLEQMKERWHVADDIVILNENIHMDEQGEIYRIYMELLDEDYIHYTIDAFQGESENRAKVLICQKDGSSTGTQIWAQGVPVEKNASMLRYLEGGYDCESSYWVQYSGRSSDEAESALLNLERVYSGEDAEGNYYCFCFILPDGEEKWESKQIFLVPAGVN